MNGASNEKKEGRIRGRTEILRHSRKEGASGQAKGGGTQSYKPRNPHFGQTRMKCKITYNIYSCMYGHKIPPHRKSSKERRREI